MSTKSTLVAAGIVLLLLAASHYFTYKTAYNKGYDDCLNTLTQDSTKKTVDTVYIKGREVTVYIPYYAEAYTDTVQGAIVYKTQIDTSVVIEQDTVMHLTQDISLTEGIFEILSEIDIFPIERIVTVDKTTFRTVVKEVTVSEFPNTFLTGLISGLVLFIIMVVAL